MIDGEARSSSAARVARDHRPRPCARARVALRAGARRADLRATCCCRGSPPTSASGRRSRRRPAGAVPRLARRLRDLPPTRWCCRRTACRSAASRCASRSCGRTTTRASPSWSRRRRSGADAVTATRTAAGAVPPRARRAPAFFAMGEAIAHLNYLWRRDRAAPTLSRRGRHRLRLRPPDPCPTTTTRTTMATPATEKPRRREASTPIALAESLAAAAEKSAKVLGEFARATRRPARPCPRDELGIAKAFMDLSAQMMRQPDAARRIADEPVVRLHAPVAGSMLKLIGAQAEPGRRAREGRHPLQGRGLGRALPLRLHQAVLPDRRAPHPRRGGERRGPARATRRRRSTSSRASTSTRWRRPTSLLTNPQVLRETVETRRPEPGARG